MSKFNLRKRPRVCYYEPEEPPFDEYVCGGIGVFTTLTLPCGVRFGPYRGTNVTKAGDTSYGWQIYDKNHKPSHIVDASDDNNSNWMRYVNCSRHLSEQNLVAYQYQGQLYYRTIKIIPRFSELLVFYGSEFAYMLEVDLRAYTKACTCELCQTQQPKKIALAKSNKRKVQNEETSQAQQKTNITQHENNGSKAQQNTSITQHENNGPEKSIETATQQGHLQPVITRHEPAKKKKRQTRSKKPINAEKKIKITTRHEKTQIATEISSGTTRKQTVINSHAKKFIVPIIKGMTSNVRQDLAVRQNLTTFKCDKCIESFNVKSDLEKHMQVHMLTEKSNAMKLTCVTVRKDHMLGHETTCKDEKPYKCSHCDYASAQKSNLVTHERAHSGEKLYKCSHCDYASAQKSNLVRHERTHSGERPYKCSHCDYASVRKDQLVKHERTHSGERPYKCSHCDYASAQKTHLVTHERTHSGERPYKCSHCDYASAQKTHLVTHERTHSGEKPYKCSHCDYADAQKSNLVRHQRTHSGERPYKCSHCDYASAQKINLVTHERKHTGELYTCDICDFKSAYEQSIKQHLIKVHSGKTS